MSIILTMLRDERGQDFAEYAVALAVIGFGAAVVALGLSNTIQSLWSAALNAIAAVAS